MNAYAEQTLFGPAPVIPGQVPQSRPVTRAGKRARLRVIPGGKSAEKSAELPAEFAVCFGCEWVPRTADIHGEATEHTADTGHSVFYRTSRPDPLLARPAAPARPAPPRATRAPGPGPRAPRRVRVGGDLWHPTVPAGAVYIGRETPGLPASPFANPYRVGQFGRTGALARYRWHLGQHPELVTRARAELAGRDIACWCSLTDRCHGDILREAIDHAA